MWRELVVDQQFAAGDELPEWCFREPASPSAIDELELWLGCALPSELDEFLRESDGLALDWGVGPNDNLIFSVAEILARNRELRSDRYSIYMPFAHLIAFAAPSNGDFFAFGVHADGAVTPEIFLWDHETDSRYQVFSSFAEFIERFNKED